MRYIFISLVLIISVNSNAWFYYTSCGGFSPDGSKVIFSSTKHHHTYIVNPDGTGRVEIEHYGTSKFFPNGEKIAFVNYGDWHGYSNLYTMNIDGTGFKQLTFYDKPYDSEGN